MRLRSVLAAVVAIVMAFPAADALAADPKQETYVIDSKGTTVFRGGVKVCRIGCAPTVSRPVPPAFSQPPLQALSQPSPQPPAASVIPLSPPPTLRLPDSVISADRYPVQPRPAPARSVFQPQPTSAVPASTPVAVQRPAAVASPPVRAAQPAALQSSSPPKKSEGFTKEQKALMLNAGAATFIIGYGVGFWDYFQTSPKAGDEGWFGPETKHRGADKLGHFWTTYTLGHAFAYAYRWWDYDAETANALGALSSLGFQTLMEVGDSFSADNGFSYEDAIMNLAGAGAAYVLGRYPELARKIDFRLEYRPSSFDDISGDILTDYESQRYLMALKLDGFDVFQNSYLSYLELHVGYEMSGSNPNIPGQPDGRRADYYFGAGFNVSKLVQNFVDVRVFDYFQLPYTSITIKNGDD